ncbi:amino acid permease [Diplodia corticola]|uniref:Amino acid permease n=1 Tax=Diplodia corticola TaxID=236234 RepID=A0A1J9RER0_9PEZI|nr:amino acid permease [Diplodia corticola]OJD31051.1 amino acid permease [Diplodia corticola]
MAGPEEKEPKTAEGEIQQDAPTPPYDVASGEVVDAKQPRQLSRSLQGRHMQMIAIGGSIGAGLFVGTGSALRTGGPASVLIGFMTIGVMMLCTVQALGELAIIYPVNGAFYEYGIRFVDPAWGVSMGWQYSVGWMLTLPFEITAAGITIEYWKSREEVNPGVWCAVFLAALIIIQIFGVRGYGEVEFVLAIIKIVACIGFIILGVVIDCGGVPTDDRGYIGARYWHDPGAFRNGFKGFCSVFVTAAFAFGGTEMVGLAAAEAANPRRSLPKATKQAFWRIFLFYVVNIFIVGLIVPSDSDVLLGASGANTKASPFVLAVQMAGIKVLPHIINAVITVAVISVANSCTYGSTRVLQAMASSGYAPSCFAKIDSMGRPIWCVVAQVAFGFLSFITVGADSDTVFTWILAITGLSGQFAYATIMLSHINFRRAWKMQGRGVDQIPWRSPFGIAGSYVGLVLVILSLVATFYVALFPIGSPPSVEAFFESYMAAPITICLFIIFQVYSKRWTVGVNLREVDLDKGRRFEEELDPEILVEAGRPVWKRVLNFLF